ncbi:MAG TPA: MFS transporter [Clostridiales bacterium]|nr:MFS transporter [Clostridiales bacterium]
MKRLFRSWQASMSELFGSREEYSRNRRYLLIVNYTSNVSANLIGGNFLTGLLLLMNAGDSYIGLITMSAMFGNMLQVLSPLLLERFPERKNVLMIGRIIVHFMNIVLISIIPLVADTDALKLSMTLIVVLIVNVFNALLAPGYQVWHIKSVPNEIRSRFFSFVQLTNSIIVYTVILISSRVVDAFKQGGNELAGLLVLRAIALVLAVFDVVYMFKIREYPVSSRKITVRDVLFSPFREKKYLLTVLMACMWSFSANIPGSYYSVYLLRDLNFSYSFINTVNMLSVPIMILVMPIWRKRVDTTSWFRALYFCISIYIVHYLGLAMVTEKNLLLYPLSMIYAFAVAPGINLVFANLPFINMPEENQTNMLGFYAAMNNFAGFLGASVGRQFITMTEGLQIKLGSTIMGNKQLILFVTAFFMLMGVLLIYRIAQKATAPEEKPA